MIGRGTQGGLRRVDGSDIEPGVHLRWQPAPELGFPSGGFDVYRRAENNGHYWRCGAYRAELQASFVVHAGGLTADGWVDPSYAWVQLTRENAKIAAVGREVWTDYRLEVNAEAVGRQIGAVARFQQDEAAGTFACYRLLINLNEQAVHLARLTGTFTGGTYELDDGGPTPIWSCTGVGCDVDFELDTHAVALACEGDDLIVEIDGVELARRSDPGGLSAGKAGLYHLGTDEPVFTDLVVRSAPRGTVHAWSFVTSRYAGFVEHLDGFVGQVHPEVVSGVDAGELADAAAAAKAELDSTVEALADARAELAGASAADVSVGRDAAQAAARSLSATAATHFDALYALLLAGAYRPLPPVVELSELMQGGRRQALLLESPEPLAWERIGWQLTRQDRAGRDQPVPGSLLVWSDDGARALVLVTGASLQAGSYELQLAYNLDIGLEAPILRRGAAPCRK